MDISIDKKQAIGLVKAIAACGLTIGSTVMSIAADGGASAGAIAATGTGIAAILATAPPWATSLMNTLGNIGLNITSNILERMVDTWRDDVIEDSSKLNHDIAKALIAACKAATVESKDYWQKNFSVLEKHVYQTNGSYDDASNILRKLENLPKHLDQVISQDDLTSTTLPDDDILNLTRKSKQEDAQASLRSIVSQRLQSYLNTPHTEAVNAIADHLTEAWLAQFQDELRNIAEDSQRAKTAFEELWRDSISSTLSDLGEQTSEIQGDVRNILVRQDIEVKTLFAIRGAIRNIPQTVAGQVTQDIMQQLIAHFDQLLSDKYPQAATLERDLRGFLRRTEPGLSADATHKLVYSLLACDALARIFHKEWSGFMQATTEELIFSVRHAETSPDAVENLDTTVQDILGLQVKLTSIEQSSATLCPFVKQLSDEKLRWAYDNAIPATWAHAFPQGCDKLQTFSRILHQFAREGDTCDQFLTFFQRLDELICHLPEKQQETANTIRYLYRAITGQDPEHWRKWEHNLPSDKPAPDTPAPVHLLVKLEDCNPMDHTYLITAWLFRGDEQTQLHDKQLRETLENIPMVLGQFLANAEKDAKVEMIEFLVPRDLLGKSFECYPRVYPEDLLETQQRRTRSIGCHYHVVVRIRGKKHYANWVNFRDKFASLAQDDPNLSCHTIETLDDKDDVFYDLINELEETQALCLVLIPPLTTDVCNDVADALIEVGTPIALWRREDIDNEGFTELLSCNLGDLRAHVKDKRKKARPKDQNHLGNHLTLLWDDPNRVPLDDTESGRLSGPEQKPTEQER